MRPRPASESCEVILAAWKGAFNLRCGLNHIHPSEVGRPRALATWAATALLATLPATRVEAHDFTITETNVCFAADGAFSIDVKCDLDALALGVESKQDSASLVRRLRALSPEELEATTENLKLLLRKRLRVRFDGEGADFEVSFPALGVGMSHASEIPTVFGVTARLSGTVPDGAREFTFWASRSFNAVHLTLRREGSEEVERQVLGVGAESRPYSLRDGALAVSAASVAWQYVALGYEHILPRGLDHILFVVGLFLLGRRWKPLLWQVTAFTVAHTLTLALAMNGAISLPSRVVEPLIALSIAYVAIENVFTTKLTPWRPGVVFAFGLLHGLGFAGVLTELGLPKGQFATALLSFNVGVEMGQLSVILAAFAVVGWFRGKDWYRSAIVVPASVAIALAGLYWCVERTLV
ncbi:MAG: HupE/UreJ family protein [Phycisphaerales bacterium]|nr:HupE/UreJ family protein [Phycisphaerales bacterium]